MRHRKLNTSLFAIFQITVLSGFTDKNEIGRCYLSFTEASNLKAVDPDRLPESSEKIRSLKTESGDVDVTRIDGYRILFNNEKKVPFVNLKIELSEKGSYSKDK